MKSEHLTQLPKNLPTRPAIEAELKRRARNRISEYYPDTGPLRRELYPKHLDFFAAGRRHRERLAIAGNRTGKTTMAAYEVGCHATGWYPEWWEGRVFRTPLEIWVAGETGKKTREVVQKMLLGPMNALGTGMIPAAAMSGRPRMKGGVPDAVDTLWIKHINGGHSHLTFKSYEQGREGFDGDTIHVIWLDEEATMAIYTECLLRTMTTDGLIMLTFTPLQGLTELVLSFLPGGRLPSEEGEEG